MTSSIPLSRRALALILASALAGPGPQAVSAFAQTAPAPTAAAPGSVSIPVGATTEGGAPPLPEAVPRSVPGLEALEGLSSLDRLSGAGRDEPAGRESWRFLTAEQRRAVIERYYSADRRVDPETAQRLLTRKLSVREISASLERAEEENASAVAERLLDRTPRRQGLTDLPSLDAALEPSAVAPAASSARGQEIRIRGEADPRPANPPAPLHSNRDFGRVAAAVGGGVLAFLAGLVLVQVGVEFLGQVMPRLVQSQFGAFSFYAYLTVFASVARVFGSAIGGALPDQIGLKATFVGSNVAKALSVGAMVGLLVTHNMTPGLLMGFYALNGLFTGIGITAETSIPARLVGKDQAKLERFWGIYQFTLEIVGITAPILAGYVIGRTGTFDYALAVYPVALAASVAVFWKFLKIPSSADVRELHRGEFASVRGGFLGKLLAALAGVFKGIAAGFKIVWRSPPLAAAVFGYVAFMLTNPILYSMIAPAYGAFAGAGDAATVSTIQGWLVGLYSFGSLLATGYMLWASKRIDRQREEGSISEEEAQKRIRRSTIGWMIAGTLSLATFVPLMWTNVPLAYGMMLLFGVGSVVPYLKLKSMAQALAPADGIEKVMGFMQAVSIAAYTGGIYLVGAILDAHTVNKIPTVDGFWWINVVFGVVAVVSIVLTFLVAKLTRPKGSSSPA